MKSSNIHSSYLATFVQCYNFNTHLLACFPFHSYISFFFLFSLFVLLMDVFFCGLLCCYGHSYIYLYVNICMLPYFYSLCTGNRIVVSEDLLYLQKVNHFKAFLKIFAFKYPLTRNL